MQKYSKIIHFSSLEPRTYLDIAYIQKILFALDQKLFLAGYHCSCVTSIEDFTNMTDIRKLIISEIIETAFNILFGDPNMDQK